ncbi:MAG: FGGY-family carbohydrate kinase [Chloroflexi bacterium]|nr:FGGY-family carbohydrate kinase [Chloroflexota bacterium]
MPAYLLGIDVGTTATKMILVNDGGRIVAETSRPSALTAPQSTWAEEDPAQWWDNVCMLVPVVLSQAGVKPTDVAAIGACGMVPALVLLDAGGAVLRPAIMQSDARAVDEIAAQRRQTDEADILARTGSPITQQSIGPKLAWLRKHEPDVMRRAARLMGSYEYITSRLTGIYTVERNWALESGLFDLHKEDWGDRLLRLAGIERAWLGDVHWPADVIGTVTRDAARATGLAEGTPVVTGSADHVASAFSAGLRQQGDLLVKLGGSGDVLFTLDHAETDPRLYLDYHVIPGKFILNGCMASSGSLIRWFRDTFAPGADYAQLDAEAASLPAGADGLILLPYFLGEKTPLNDPLARGTLVGLTLSHTRAHVFRAVLEGISFGFQHHMDVLAEHNYRPARGRLTNGGAHSALWRQITSDVLGLPLEAIAHHPGSSLGAAFVAGKGVGVFADWGDIERCIEVSSVTQPNMRNHERYRVLFPLYREIYEKLRDTYPALVRITAQGASAT